MKLAEMINLAPDAPPDPSSPLGKILTKRYAELGKSGYLVAGSAMLWLNLINQHGIPEDLEAIIHGEGE